MMYDDTEDTLVWGPSNSGTYTTKSAYEWLLPEPINHLTFTGSWTWVWKQKLPEKIKFFIWLIQHESLPTNLLRIKWHFSFASSYCRCGLEEENITYLLRDCFRNTKSHVDCLYFLECSLYIFVVRQFHFISIDFKKKSNMV